MRENQVEQFLEYSGNDDIVANEIYNMASNRIFYWKNTDYSSHVLHPFMYNLKIWNKLNNIIINGYKNYANSDLIDYLTSKTKFDELFGEYGEGRNFWKYNVMDLSGYTTRYEASIKDEHKDDYNHNESELTGYDGLFYPTAALEYLNIHNESIGLGFSIPDGFFTDELGVKDGKATWSTELEKERMKCLSNPFIRAIYSIYCNQN